MFLVAAPEVRNICEVGLNSTLVKWLCKYFETLLKILKIQEYI